MNRSQVSVLIIDDQIRMLVSRRPSLRFSSRSRSYQWLTHQNTCSQLEYRVVRTEGTQRVRSAEWQLARSLACVSQRTSSIDETGIARNKPFSLHLVILRNQLRTIALNCPFIVLLSSLGELGGACIENEKPKQHKWESNKW